MSSTTYIKRPSNITATDDCLAYTKQILGGRMFSGSYLERRYVAALGEYRDVVLIHNEETELCRDLDKVVKKWVEVPDVKWTGISCPGSLSLSTYRLWVKLSNLPMDSYWFQIKHVRLVENELSFHLKCLRKAPTVTKSMCQSASTKNETSTSGESSMNACEIISCYIKNYSEVMWGRVKEAHEMIMENITWESSLRTVKTTFAVMVLCLCGFLSCVKSVSEYLLILIRELSNLVHAFTPIMIHLIDFCSKIVGALSIIVVSLLGKTRYNNFQHNNTRSRVMYASLPPSNVNWQERNRLLKEELLGVQKWQ